MTKGRGREMDGAAANTLAYGFICMKRNEIRFQNIYTSYMQLLTTASFHSNCDRK